MTHSLPVQYVLASLASHVTIPRNSSGRPIRPSGLWLAHTSTSSGRFARNCAVILFPIAPDQLSWPPHKRHGRTMC